MAKQDFDDLMKVIDVQNLYASDTVVSVEIDLELPRGYIAKIKIVRFDIEDIGLDVDGIVNGQWQYRGALVRDPDDDDSIEIPNNEVQHDVICDHNIEVMVDATATQGNAFATVKPIIYEFAKNELDVITARNMRYNVAASGADKANATMAISHCAVWYTLEKVSDSDILNLLDIL